MCTAINTPAMIAEEDIIVYKMMHRVCYIRMEAVSFFMGKHYSLNTQYDTDFQYENEDALLDDEEIRIVENHYKCDFNQFPSNEDYKVVTDGFHSFRTIDRMKICSDENIIEIRPETAYSICIIPKGTKYHIGIDDQLIVSESIIITGNSPLSEEQENELYETQYQ